MNRKIPAFTKGIHNLFDDEIISDDAFVSGKGWITNDGAIELARGRNLYGDEGAAGSVSDIHFGYKVDGTTVAFKKSGTTVQVLIDNVWTDVITGLTENAPTSFANYSSLAGTFVFVYSTDGIWKIVTANPTDALDMYDSERNFKGIAFIESGRSILWAREQDKTGVYGSWIDSQDSVVYATVSSEAVGSLGSTAYTGTLNVQSEAGSGQGRRSLFALTITDGTQTLTDDFNGGFTGDGTGTINYATGEYSVTFDATTTGAVTADYKWEDSAFKSVCDFRKSTPRVAAEGFLFPQDSGGDAIQTILSLDGTYFSLKEKSVYSLTISDDDTDATNIVFRTNIGIPTSKAGVATSKGIIFVNTNNIEDPVLNILTRNPIGDVFDTQPIFAHFDFSDYRFDDTAMSVYGDYVLITCKTKTATANDNILLCNYINQTVDVLSYSSRCFTTDAGNLYSGDSLSTNTYQILSGFDDLGYVIENEITSKGDTYGLEVLKKQKRLRFRGEISVNQSVEVYGSFDRNTFTLLGTIHGKASYVDTENPSTVGLSLVGADVVGGSETETVYPYFAELKIKTPKFRKRHLKFKATGFGYVSIKMQEDRDVWTYTERMPRDFRQKQNVSIDGTTTDNATPDY